MALQFDHTGSLLLTCDRVGNYFNLFRIVPHPAGAGYAAVHHLYSLYRGDTPGSVQVTTVFQYIFLFLWEKTELNLKHN